MLQTIIVAINKIKLQIVGEPDRVTTTTWWGGGQIATIYLGKGIHSCISFLHDSSLNLVA